MDTNYIDIGEFHKIEEMKRHFIKAFIILNWGEFDISFNEHK